MIRMEEKIKKYVRCCACGGSLENSAFINSVTLNKLATWKHPTWGNVLVKDKYPEPRATAILCDNCIEKQVPPKFAVEWDLDKKTVTYHDIKQLKDLPKIKTEDVLEAESKLALKMEKYYSSFFGRKAQ